MNNVHVVILMAITGMAFAQQQVLFLPSFGAQSQNGWNARLQGLVYEPSGGTNKLPSDWSDILDSLTDLSSQEQQNLADRLAPFRWDLKSGQTVTVNFSNGGTATTSNSTGLDGRFDEFVPVAGNLPAGSILNFTNPNEASPIGDYDVLLDPQGVGIIMDIDDVTKETRIWDPSGAIRNTFAENYTPVPGMPEVVNKWYTTLRNPGLHFVTDIPILLAPAYIEWLPTYYPLHTLDMRPLDITDIGSIVDSRKDNTIRLLQTYPNRTFVMVGDTYTPSLVSVYGDLARSNPQQVQCIFIRNISATEPTLKFGNMSPEDITERMEDVPPERWFVFDQTSTLQSIDVAGGNCHPPGYGPFDVSESGNVAPSSSAKLSWAPLLVGLALVMAMMV